MPTSEASPRFSVVSAVYNVGRYLDEYITSIERQNRTDLEVILVDDGSTDDSLERLRAWQSRRPDLVRIVEKVNGGQASARNAGLAIARGEWITFTDPDDVLDQGYFDAVAEFADANPDVSFIGTYRLLLRDDTGKIEDVHPLKHHFRSVDRAVDLSRSPGTFYGSAPCAFFRLDLLREFGLEFPEDIKPNFEDGYLCDIYILKLPIPKIGLLSSARYLYRKRSDASSTLQTSLVHPGRYTTVLRNGYLRIMHDALRIGGEVPRWLQTHIIYELSWNISTQDNVAGGSPPVEGAVADEYHALMKEICSLLDLDVIETFRARRLRPIWRDVLAHGYADQPWHQSTAVVDRPDPARRLVRVRYRFTGSLPVEQFLVNGAPRDPAFAKTRAVDYHSRVLIQERILWFPQRSRLRMKLDGEAVVLVEKEEPPAYDMNLRTVAAQDAREPASASVRRLSPADRLLLRLARLPAVRRRFAGAWVLMDRLHDADDSGEILFRYLRKHRRSINAWFVIQAGTPDYQRLREAGYKRVVAHGSTVWKLLMLNASHLISSHADGAVIAPREVTRLIDPTWRFTFLQHGVIKDDLSEWLNPKRIDTFITSTTGEYESIAGDGNRYVYSPKEVQLTGLPRFDKLRRIGRGVPEEERDLILLTPTWRQWLQPPLEQGSQRRRVLADFFDSQFAREWLGLLGSPAVAAACRANNLRIGFLPHPNLQTAIPSLDIPDHVEVLSYDVPDVQRHFARAAVMVTDYSSTAFNAAYIDRPVVYFQFDAAQVLGGGHVGRRGYFDYEQDGFGPVTRTVAEAESAVLAIVRAGRRPQALYQERIEATFPQRDGRCCRRVTDAILASGKRWRPPPQLTG